MCQRPERSLCGGLLSGRPRNWLRKREKSQPSEGVEGGDVSPPDLARPALASLDKRSFTVCPLELCVRLGTPCPLFSLFHFLLYSAP